MAITADVKNQLFTTGHYGNGQLIRLPSEASTSSFHALNGEDMTVTNTNGRAWTTEEHNRFLEGLELFPSGPWKEIAAHVGSRTTRQTMTHAQKYREKIARRKRGLRSSVKDTHLFKRQRHHHERKAKHKTVSATTSPCSVAMPSVSARRNVDSMDAHEYLVSEPVVIQSQYEIYNDLDPISNIEISSFAATLSDYDPLPMSEEEIDFILEAATFQPPTFQTYHSSCSDDIFFQ
ncbi:unnamed protein product [Peronospora belbahrii]|uniref:Uncharacterized protein n=1 Tax=Peronospora belbahrii TaxID=622444 RepID=A0AAU9KY34_9STRA|nr:unnamed protein product [Peronospora belbahrii]CAH0514647.1 unnamed protein product [Peronospora belbahrii]